MAMTSLMVLLLFFLLHSSATTAATAAITPAYKPTDYILLDCGSSSSSTSVDGRNWQADENTLSVSLPPNPEKSSQLSKASEQSSSAQQIPYISARIFYSEFKYTFPQLSSGSKFLRLYFYSSTYNKLNKNSSFFSVIANKYTLLSNFSVFCNSPSDPLVKEYIIHIPDDDQQLSLTFLPSKNSFAFVNGIEIVSIPDRLYHPGDSVPIRWITENRNSFYYVLNETALETVHRLNVGGSSVEAMDDTGMYRSWEQDDDYLLQKGGRLTGHDDFEVEYTSSAPSYTAPEDVYTTARIMNDKDNISMNYNLTWWFSVDSGFYYLLRLHFCEFFAKIKNDNDRVFSIFINNKTAEDRASVILWGDHRPRVAVFKDYVAFVADPDGRKSKQELWLAMHPQLDTGAAFANAILNGLEIFKLSLSNGNLSAPNPPPPESTEQSTSPDNKNSNHFPLIVAVTGGAALVVAAAASFVGFLIFRRRRRLKDHSATTTGNKSSWFPLSNMSRLSTTTAGSTGSSLPANQCRYFPLEEILDATGNFDVNFVIGVGGFGNVYKGYIDNGATEVAIKRLNSSSNQGSHEFFTEIKMLSSLRHRHLVSLIGYCNDNGEMILVYNYMSRGTLRDHLYYTENFHLSWKQRLEICIGAAEGLHYLHTSGKHTIIHRDVKSTNILLDEKWVAKVSDFGLSKMGPVGGVETHVSTAVKGSFGYMDPEYYKSQRLTEKSDVYSFGVVLFEVLCARPAIIQNVPKEQVNLVKWACACNKRGTLDQIIDSKVKGEIAAESLNKYVDVAFRCLKDEGTERPTMNDVMWSLEFSLSLQKDAEKRGSTMEDENENETNPTIPLVQHGGAATKDNGDSGMFSRLEEAASSSSKSKSSSEFTNHSYGFKSETVFSEIMKPSAR